MINNRSLLWTLPFVATLVLAGCDSGSETTAETTQAPVQEVLAQPARDAGMIASARYGIPIDQEGVPEAIAPTKGANYGEARNYPMQPPLIPHGIRGYEVNLNSNRCMACHSRREVAETRATMISVTHYMDRQGNFLAEISPRRYFCTQCHVVQTETANIVDNSFEDMDDLIKQLAQAEGE